MADKSFGVKELNIIGTGTPTIQSPNSGDLNITAATSTYRVDSHVAIGATYVTDLGDSAVTLGAGYSASEGAKSGTKSH